MLHVEVLYFIYVAGNFLTKSIPGTTLEILYKGPRSDRDPIQNVYCIHVASLSLEFILAIVLRNRVRTFG